MSGILQQISRSSGGIPKLPVNGPVQLTSAGVAGDRQRNLRYHGGPKKAVLMIAAEALAGLAKKGFPVSPGALGENLTVSGLDPHLWRSGQQYRIGADVVIELTTLRVPCATLYPLGRNIGDEIYDKACNAGDVRSPLWAHAGFYASIVQPGILVCGAAVTLQSDLA